MRFASLGSGSRGNALVVEAGGTRVLVDCGFGPRELAGRLARLGLAPGDLDAIVVSHEHGDHVGGVERCAVRHGLPAYMSHGTHAAARPARGDIRIFDSHAAFAVGDLEIRPYPVPHDAREPVQFVLTDGKCRLGVLTDAGCVTPHMLEMLAGCDALVIECNHDIDMLMAGRYPRMLKARIAGRLGHLDNRAAADCVERVGGRRMQHVIAAHLSEQNNTPALARAALAAVLGCRPAEVDVADQQGGFGWRSIA